MNWKLAAGSLGMILALKCTPETSQTYSLEPGNRTYVIAKQRDRREQKEESFMYNAISYLALVKDPITEYINTGTNPYNDLAFWLSAITFLSGISPKNKRKV